MIDSNFFKKSKLNIKNVSRETFNDLNEYVNLVVHKNREINMISKSSEKSINTRHLLDSAQIIEFVDKKDINLCTDIGSGAGFPGIVLAILMKSKNPLFKLIFYEKSFHKSNFLKSVSQKLKLNSEINQKNIFEEKNLTTDIIVSRAFKPLPTIFEIACNNFKKFKYIILFLGRSGKEILKDAKKKWSFDYEKKKKLNK